MRLPPLVDFGGEMAMMGFHFDREYGPGTKRRFTFDFDEFLEHLLILVVLVLIVTAIWRMGLFSA